MFAPTFEVWDRNFGTSSPAAVILSCNMCTSIFRHDQQAKPPLFPVPFHAALTTSAVLFAWSFDVARTHT